MWYGKWDEKMLLNTGTKTWVQIYPRVSANQPSNNWAEGPVARSLVSVIQR